MPKSPAVPHPLPDALAEVIAQRFRVLGEPMRIKLLDRLREGPASVSQLQESTGASQQNVSKHLGVLLSAAMVSRSRDGNLVIYAISDDTVFDLCETICGGIRRQVDELQAAIADVPAR